MLFKSRNKAIIYQLYFVFRKLYTTTYSIVVAIKTKSLYITYLTIFCALSISKILNGVFI